MDKNSTKNVESTQHQGPRKNRLSKYLVGALEATDGVVVLGVGIAGIAGLAILHPAALLLLGPLAAAAKYDKRVGKMSSNKRNKSLNKRPSNNSLATSCKPSADVSSLASSTATLSFDSFPSKIGPDSIYDIYKKSGDAETLVG